ncbi:MAG: anaerobic ribonucleoside-triphosphate reductase activating protein [bacterium]
MKIEIKGFLETSMINWEGMIVSVLYTSHCNFRCPYCQNPSLVLEPEQLETVPVAKIASFLIKKKGWVEGICLTGGEPCMFADLPDFLKKIRATGAKIKLDTNGAFPEMLEKLIDEKLVDYIAMDVKAPLDEEKYSKAAGGKVDIARIKKSIDIIRNSGLEYEFRTTVVPTIVDEDDIMEIAKYLKGSKKYALQNFSTKEVLEASFKKIKPYKREVLEDIVKKISPFFEKCMVRGK